MNHHHMNRSQSGHEQGNGQDHGHDHKKEKNHHHFKSRKTLPAFFILIRSERAGNIHITALLIRKRKSYKLDSSQYFARFLKTTKITQNWTLRGPILI